MKIVILQMWHSEGMGYSDYFLSKYLAKEGHEVHLVTSTAQIYYNSIIYKDTYQKFLGEPIQPECVKKTNGYTLHRLPFTEKRGGIVIQGLKEYLKKLNPDIVQTIQHDNINAFEAAKISFFQNFKLFTELHIHASIFPNYDKKRTLRQYLGHMKREGLFYKLLNQRIKLCYPISIDSADIAYKYFKIPQNKIKIQSLGVDTELFCPPTTEKQLKNRDTNRQKWGFAKDDIVCIYTGRFTYKGADILARAINHLHENGETKFKGFFVGSGEKEDIETIKNCKGCTIHNFVPALELPNFYQAADIAVWPKQESTSQLDAASSGLPLILGNTITVKERVDGNGLLYEEDNFVNLADKIKSLKSKELRDKMGGIGVENMQKLSWDNITKERIKDYERFLKK